MSISAISDEEEFLCSEIRYLTNFLKGYTLSSPKFVNAQTQTQTAAYFEHLAKLLSVGTWISDAVSVSGRETKWGERCLLISRNGGSPNSEHDNEENLDRGSHFRDVYGDGIHQRYIHKKEFKERSSNWMEIKSGTDLKQRIINDGLQTSFTFIRFNQNCFVNHARLTDRMTLLLQEGHITIEDYHRLMLFLGGWKFGQRLRLFLDQRFYRKDILAELKAYEGQGIEEGSLGKIEDVPECLHETIQWIEVKFPTYSDGLDTRFKSAEMNNVLATAWTTIIAGCLQALAELFSERIYRLSFANVSKAHDILALLRWAVNQNAIRALFRVPALSTHFEPTRSQVDPGSLSNEDSLHEVDYEALLEKHFVTSLSESDPSSSSVNDHGSQFLKHIRALHEWLCAITYLKGYLDGNDPVFKPGIHAIRIVRTGKPSLLEQSVLDGLDLSNSTDISRDTFIDESQTHCEAVYMVMQTKASNVWPTESSSTESSDSDAGDGELDICPREFPVSVSRSCCWSCFKLYEIIKEEGVDMSHFQLSTHGIVLPWIPPPGLPLEVLQKLRDALFAEYQKRFSTDRTVPPSPDSGNDRPPSNALKRPLDPENEGSCPSKKRKETVSP